MEMEKTEERMVITATAIYKQRLLDFYMYVSTKKCNRVAVDLKKKEKVRQRESNCQEQVP